jgi:hypothetical protein
VVQSAQHSFAAHPAARRKPVSILRPGWRGMVGFRDTRSQAHVNAAVIVMAYPTVENVLEMSSSQRNEEILALPADGSNHSLANGICCGRAGRRRNSRRPMAATARSTSWEEDAVAVSWSRKLNDGPQGVLPGFVAGSTPHWDDQ